MPVILSCRTSSQKGVGPMGQPRRQKPPLVMGISDGRKEFEESHWLGTTRRDLDLLRWRPREGLSLNDVQCSRETLRGAHQGSIVEVPGIQSEGGNLGLDTLDDGIES